MMRSSNIWLTNVVAAVTCSVVLFDTQAGQAALVLGSNDARTEYPLSAPVITAPLPLAEGGTADSRGVRSTRNLAQSFQVQQPFSLESIYIGYRWNEDDGGTLPTTFRLLEIDDIGLNYDPNTATVLAGPLTTSLGSPTNPVSQGYYAMRLDWTGPDPLVLAPRTGQQGYAMEFVGGGGSSPIAIVFRSDDPYAQGRALDPVSGISEEREFVIALTGSVVPEPSAAILLLLGLMVAGTGRRAH